MALNALIVVITNWFTWRVALLVTPADTRNVDNAWLIVSGRLFRLPGTRLLLPLF